MDEAVDFLWQAGQFAALVIAVLVVVMLFFSLVDGFPRKRDSNDKRDQRD